MRTIALWLALGALVGVACGAASAAFLFLLDRATRLREEHVAVVYTLPIAGVLIGLFYERYGQPIRGGNDLVIDTVHRASPQISFRMAPMVLIGTVLTHLFGGSAGREGTAVQMGASLADAIAHRARVDAIMRRQILVAGIAGGFGSVFGTPVAGLIFGLEVITIRRFEHRAFVPALVAAFVGDWVTRRLGVAHTPYPLVHALGLGVGVIGKLVLIGAAMAAATFAFVLLTHSLKKLLEARIPRLPLRMLVGGVMVVALWKLVGSSEYLGLGVPTIVRAFHDPSLPAYAFLAKIVLTAVTLGAGFLGGEVTPLFFVGATLGNVLARHLGLPLEIGAGVGIAAVFGAASRAPLALIVMAVELLGPAILPHVAIVTMVAYALSGPDGIYTAQRRPLRTSNPPSDRTQK